MLPITPEQHRNTSLVSMNSVIMAPLRDRFVCCCQMFCSPQWQQWCCTSRSLGRVPARCLGPCVCCCCWVPCTARLCRLSPAGGPRAVQLPAAPQALRAEGGGFSHCQALHNNLPLPEDPHLLAHTWTPTLRKQINVFFLTNPYTPLQHQQQWQTKKYKTEKSHPKPTTDAALYKN